MSQCRQAHKKTLPAEILQSLTRSPNHKGTPFDPVRGEMQLALDFCMQIELLVSKGP